MIFYLIPATTDQPAELAPTQADANGGAKARGLKIKAADMQHDVPTDKAGLMGYINAMLVTQHNLHQDADGLQHDMERAVERETELLQPKLSEPTAEAITAKVGAVTSQMIEEFILERASVAQVEQIMARIGTRFAEMVKGSRS